MRINCSTWLRLTSDVTSSHAALRSIVHLIEGGAQCIVPIAAIPCPSSKRGSTPRKTPRFRYANFRTSSFWSFTAADRKTVKSDQCPRYLGLVRKHLPGAEHKTFKGRRGCVVGQGELKAGGRDPLYSLNQTCAMVRDNVKCLSRKTWCTTKRIDRLQCRLDLYVCWHNAVIDEAREAAERRNLKRQGRLQSAQKVWPLGLLALGCA